MPEVLFYLFAAMTLVPALLMVASRNTVNCAMLMIVSFVGTASLFALLQAFLLTVLQIMVYAGAIVVLFLFIIMLLDVGRVRAVRGGAGKLVCALVFFVALAACPVLAILSSRGGAAPVGEAVPAASSAANFGMLLFTKYQLPFELTGFLLLAAMVGVIYISRRAPAAEPSEAPEAVEK